MVIVQIDERIEVEINEIVSYIYIYIVYIRSVKFATSDTNLSKHLTAIKKIIDRESSWGKKNSNAAAACIAYHISKRNYGAPFTRLGWWPPLSIHGGKV